MMPSRRSESGAVAVVIALMAVLIFGTAALAVDLGNAYARKRAAQTQADMVALAAAAQLPNTTSSATAIETALEQYSLRNEIPGQDPATWNWDLADSDRTDGFVEFDNPNRLRVYAPLAHVNFGLARVFGIEGADLSAVAAAEIRSPGRGLPFFISQTCSWGQQTVLDATRGRPVPPGYAPTFVAPTPGLTAPYISSSKIQTIDPAYVANDMLPPPAMTITSTTTNGLNGVDLIGFTTEAGQHHQVNVSPSGSSVTITIPAPVLTADDTLWWVRLHKTTPDRWSAPVDAKYFEVGDPVRVFDSRCDSKNSGNFGSLQLSRDDVSGPAYWLEENLAQGIQHDLGAYPPPYPSACAGEPAAVTDSGAPDDSRTLNCLQTDSGSDLQQRATEAFILGTRGGTDPRLDGVDHPTATNCSPNEDSDEREVRVSGTPYYINDDVLSCYIETPGVTVGQISSDSAPAGVLSADIFTSPRFMWLPVLVDDPSRGTAGSYAIVGMRPAFITEQEDSATKDDPLATEANGVEMSSNGIEKIKVRAIHPLALPEFAGVVTGGTIPYIGVGTKVVELVE